MGDLIRVNFGGCMSLVKAKEFLGHGYFMKALLKWSIPELQRSVNAGEAVLTGASDAYEAILLFRVRRLGRQAAEIETTNCQVYEFKRAA